MLVRIAVERSKDLQLYSHTLTGLKSSCLCVHDRRRLMRPDAADAQFVMVLLCIDPSVPTISLRPYVPYTYIESARYHQDITPRQGRSSRDDFVQTRGGYTRDENGRVPRRFHPPSRCRENQLGNSTGAGSALFLVVDEDLRYDRGE